MNKSLKSFAFIGLLGLSFNTLAISEGYLIHDNGTLSVLKSEVSDLNQASFIKPTFFFNSYNTKEAKSHYIIDKNENLYTLSSDGFIYEKKFYEIKGRIKDYGGSFFTTSKNDLYVISKEGFIIRHSENDDIKFKRLKVVGGNYMVTREEKLIVVRSDGSYQDMTSQFKHKASDVSVGGDNYFITEDGTLYSIGEERLQTNGKESVISYVFKTPLKNIIPTHVPSQKLSVVGGNYFFDYAYNIHTISAKGIVDQNITGRKLLVENVNGAKYGEKPSVIGSSYFSFKDGIIFQVADDGLYYEIGRPDRKVLFTNFNSFEKKK